MSGEGEETRVNELERLRKWKAEALEVMRGLEDVGHALGVELGERITGRTTVDRALDLRNERDRAVATVAAVRALAESWKYDGRYGYDDGSHATGPGPDDTILDGAAADLLGLLDGVDTGHGSRDG